MYNYETANKSLQGRCKNSRKVANNTYLHRNNNNIAVKLHDTDVITFKPNGDVVLNSGTWHTHTTKDRINAFQDECLITQHLHKWYVHTELNGHYPNYKDAQSLFYDNIVIRDGKVLKPKLSDPEHDKYARWIKRYCDKIKKLKKLPDPSSGDCWFCLLETAEGQSLGDISGNKSHIISHLKEQYVHGSLIINAMKARGRTNMGIAYLWQSDVRDLIVHDVRWYLKRMVL